MKRRLIGRCACSSKLFASTELRPNTPSSFSSSVREGLYLLPAEKSLRYLLVRKAFFDLNGKCPSGADKRHHLSWFFHWTKNWICIKFAACKLNANSKFAHSLPKIILMM